MKNKISRYSDGFDLQWLKDHPKILASIIETIRSETYEPLTHDECMREVERLCNKNVKHWWDCKCAICR
jgi:hypothetical protein